MLSTAVRAVGRSAPAVSRSAIVHFRSTTGAVGQEQRAWFTSSAASSSSSSSTSSDPSSASTSGSPSSSTPTASSTSLSGSDIKTEHLARLRLRVPAGAERSVSFGGPSKRSPQRRARKQNPSRSLNQNKANGSRDPAISLITPKTRAVAKWRKKGRRTSIEVVISEFNQSRITTLGAGGGEGEGRVGSEVDEVGTGEVGAVGRDLPPHRNPETGRRVVRADSESDDSGIPIPDSEVFELFQALSTDADMGPSLYEELATGTISASNVKIKAIKGPREAKIARLAPGLQRVLFNPGVQHLRDPRTGVYNFGERFSHIPSPEEFAFDRTPQYITASRDEELAKMAKLHQLKFAGSTSTLTKSLSQIYFAMSGMRGVDLSSLSKEFTEERDEFTPGARLPACLIVRRLQSGVYAVDNDKRYDVNENVLSDYGRILEKLLTTTPEDFQRFLTSSPPESVSESERNEREAYHYIKSKNLLMRSQLDCHDPRLPGSGVFDIKTRACMPIRHDRANYQRNNRYAIYKTQGLMDSFEREYYDLIRSGMLKFNLQARIGDMDGIFVAYHNTVSCFGFQYLPRTELDKRLFGSSEFGDQAFNLSVAILETILEQATETFPDQTIDVVISREVPNAHGQVVTAYVQPHFWAPEQAESRPIRAITVSMRSLVNGERSEIVEFSEDIKERRKQMWSIDYVITRTTDDDAGRARALEGLNRSTKKMRSMLSLSVPEGKTKEEMYKLSDAKRPGSSSSVPTSATPSVKIDAESASIEGLNKADAAESKASTDNASKTEKFVSEQGEEEYARTKWKDPDLRIRQLREMAKESGKAYEAIQKKWYKEHGERKNSSWVSTFHIKTKD